MKMLLCVSSGGNKKTRKVTRTITVIVSFQLVNFWSRRVPAVVAVAVRVVGEVLVVPGLDVVVVEPEGAQVHGWRGLDIADEDDEKDDPGGQQTSLVLVRLPEWKNLHREVLVASPEIESRVQTTVARFK